MAVVLDQLAFAVEALHPKLNEELLSEDCATLRLLQEAQVDTDTGDPIDVYVRYKRNNGGFYSGYDRFNVEDVDQLGKGSLEWKEAYVNVTIKETELVKNVGVNLRTLRNMEDLSSLTASDRKAVINLADVKFRNAIDDMKDILAVGIHAEAPGPKDIETLVNIISTDTAYAGIAYDAFGTFERVGLVTGTNDDKWAGIVDSNSGTNRDITVEILGDAINDASVGARRPRYCCMGRDAYMALTYMLETEHVLNDAAVGQIGFTQNLIWPHFNVTFIQDDKMDTNRAIMWNPKHLKLYVHPGLNFVFSGFKEPDDQAAVSGQLKCMVQLWCDDRSKQARIDDLSNV